MKHLLGIDDLSNDDIDEILVVAQRFSEANEQPLKKSAELRGKSIVSLFYENSTRTRLSFETAAKRMSGDFMNLGVSTSSAQKGESLRDTVETIDAMGIDAIIIRHGSSGVAKQATQWTTGSIINAGDGAHEHPTQSLLDCLTLRQHFGHSGLGGKRIAFVGDIAHSRVARSGIRAFTRLGAEVTLVAPPTMLPMSLDGWPVTVAHDLDEVLTKVDVIYTIRPQAERIKEALLPSIVEYAVRYSITRDRFARLDENVMLLEAGPLVRGIQMAPEVADNARNLMLRQVSNGVAVRMAVLDLLLNDRESNG